MANSITYKEGSIISKWVWLRVGRPLHFRYCSMVNVLQRPLASGTHRRRGARRHAATAGSLSDKPLAALADSAAPAVVGSHAFLIGGAVLQHAVHACLSASHCLHKKPHRWLGQLTSTAYAQMNCPHTLAIVVTLSVKTRSFSLLCK